MSAPADALARSRAQHGQRGPSAGGEARLCCPWCAERHGKPDTKWALSLHAASGLYYCHRCGAGGRVEGPGFAQDGRSRVGWGVGGGRGEIGPPAGFCAFTGSATEGPFRAYLERRGVLAAALACGVGYAWEGRYAGRAIVPVREGGGAWAGFVARAIWPGVAPTYLYPPGMRRGLALFNALALDDEDDAPAIVVEGVFDALALAPDAVAVLGKPTAAQRGRLALARRPVVVALDGDAWREGMALALQLRALGCEAAWLRLPPRTDPDELPARAIRERAREALEGASA